VIDGGSQVTFAIFVREDVRTGFGFLLRVAICGSLGQLSRIIGLLPFREHRRCPVGQRNDSASVFALSSARYSTQARQQPSATLIVVLLRASRYALTRTRKESEFLISSGDSCCAEK
jgi:hypothetical protein